METFLHQFNALAAVSDNINDEMEKRIRHNFDQYQDACKPYNGKSKANVIANGSNKRDNLIDSIFSLKEVCCDLFDVLLYVFKKKESNIVNAENIPGILEQSFKKFSDDLNNNILNALQSTGSTMVSKPQEKEEKHIIILENKDSDVQAYNTGTWSDVVKNKITPTLKTIPVQKTTLSKEGKGCLFFPNFKAQQEAKLALESDFTVSAATKATRSVFPKLKIFNINNEIYTEKDQLKQSILEKNSDINYLVQKGSIFDILRMDKNKHTAIVKVSPDIRKIMVKENRVYLDMTSLRVRDHFLPMQCYSCQCYGHKQGSTECKNNGSGESVCLYCAENHASKTCPVKQKSELHKCSNCLTSSNPAHKANACHTSTSLSCPHTIRETNALIRRTAGLTDAEAKKFLIKQG